MKTRRRYGKSNSKRRRRKSTKKKRRYRRKSTKKKKRRRRRRRRGGEPKKKKNNNNKTLSRTTPFTFAHGVSLEAATNNVSRDQRRSSGRSLQPKDLQKLQHYDDQEAAISRYARQPYKAVTSGNFTEPGVGNFNIDE